MQCVIYLDTLTHCLINSRVLIRPTPKVFRMLPFLLSLVLVTMAFLLGVLVVHAISIIPISILARAEQAGRYVRLGTCGPLLRRTRTSGRRLPPGRREGRMSSELSTARQIRSMAGPLALAPLNSVSLRDQAYALLKNAIADTDIYSERRPLRLDERQLTQALGVSRTPVREALSILEQEGFVHR